MRYAALAATHHATELAAMEAAAVANGGAGGRAGGKGRGAGGCSRFANSMRKLSNVHNYPAIWCLGLKSDPGLTGSARSAALEGETVLCTALG